VRPLAPKGGLHERTAGAASHPGIGPWIERRARVAAHQVALIDGDTHRTYAELATRVRRLALGLRSLGLTRGDRLGWLGPNHPAFLEGFFAAATLGAALTPINHRLDPGTVEAIGADAAPRIMLLDESLAGIRLPSDVAATIVLSPSGEPASQYERLIAETADGPLDEAVAPDDLCFLPFTSGTTGKPKGVMLTHRNLTWNILNCLSCLDVRNDDVTVAAAPFFRTGGIGVTVLPVLFMGGTVVVPRSLDPDNMLTLLERHHVTIGFGNPDLLEALTRSSRWRSANLARLRTFVTGGAPVPDRLLRMCQERGVNVLQGYGLSEAAPLVSVLDTTHASRKIGSAGRPAMFVDTRIATPEGSDTPVGEVGELLVRGPNVMAGYWRQPEATRHAIDAQGWLRTGDAALADDEGFLFIVGRVEDAYVSAGQLVHPGIAERVLLEHPSVAEICVLGGDGGAVAYVVPAPGASTGIEAALLSLCAEHLPVQARPFAIELVASLPRNPGGKIMRHLLRGRPTASAGVPWAAVPTRR
jgi:fatty-acyl-CoA synthase